MSLSHFPINPNYGTGCYHRLVRTFRVAGKVLVTVDDTHHSMWLMLSHSGARVTGIEGCIARGPATCCGAAALPLTAIVGLPLDGDVNALHECLPAVSNCTHLIDLAHWAFRSATSNASIKREILISVPDEADAPVWIWVERDGAVAHRWKIRNHHIVAPAELTGAPLMRGFLAWAREHFCGESLDLAIMLQRGVFVARGRRHLVDLSPPTPLKAATNMGGACHSYSGANFDHATNMVGYVRDFTDGVEISPVPSHISNQFKGIYHD